ncbi:hypothetical protein RA210_U30185 [Rubrivivax sp. A210]|uniref:helix-turn-helix transcriptional regulator n=1 Tax=Rubrivivax sp. A210 TaxID=2772301 RepID=UPI00191B3339|nr:helix-turn-helix transcriptional regulator [Rubrivivax sp. A210]CAD5373273.1 hypothetical protein RA210_U30185 [Rubrivivax sp. A210]
MITAHFPLPTVHTPVARTETLRPHAVEESTLTRWLAQSLDHVGHGMLLVSAGARVLHANRQAHAALDELAPLRIECGRLVARTAVDTAALQDALQAAIQRGLRRMISLGSGSQAATLAVLPLASAGEDGSSGAALVSLPQSRRTHDLAVHNFARMHGFTAAETAVLEGLLEGQRPTDIALAKGVQLSTIRTQIGQLRQKCGAHSIRELLARVAALPPMLALVQ